VTALEITGLVLAAGRSSRAGVYKMTHMLMDKPVIEHVIDAMFTVCANVRIVTGFEADRLFYLKHKYPNLELVHNGLYDEGMFGSVKVGISGLSCDRVFITPGDCPAAPPRVYSDMLSVGADIAVPAFGGIKGHPVLLSKKAAADILDCGFISLKEFISSYGYAVCETCDPGILLDLDCPGDFTEAERYLRNQAGLLLMNEISSATIDTAISAGV
jgi:molybdenum cofactor cytidylyltransferase